MRTPRLRQCGNLLKAKGIGDSAMVAKLLIEQSDRYGARGGS